MQEKSPLCQSSVIDIPRDSEDLTLRDSKHSAELPTTSSSLAPLGAGEVIRY
jgi:hypothetical protein